MLRPAGLILVGALPLLLPGTLPAQESPPSPQNNGSVQLPQRDVSLKRFLPNFFEDQKRIWLFPLHAFTSGGVVPTVGFLAATTGLVYADRHDTSYFRSTTSFSQFNSAFSSLNTGLATAAVPIAFYAVGLARKDSYTSRTGLLIGEAVADAEVMDLATKIVSRRRRPETVPVHGDFEDTWFRTSPIQSGFVSGHAIAAFSVATIVARRSPDHRWVRYTAYAGAALIAFSRVSLTKHFPSDVFAGAGLGYAISRFAVLQP